MTGKDVLKTTIPATMVRSATITNYLMATPVSAFKRWTGKGIKLTPGGK